MITAVAHVPDADAASRRSCAAPATCCCCSGGPASTSPAATSTCSPAPTARRRPRQASPRSSIRRRPARYRGLHQAIRGGLVQRATTSARAASPSRSPRCASRRGSAPPIDALPARRCRRPRCSPSRPAASSSRSPEPTSTPVVGLVGGATHRLGTVTASRCSTSPGVAAARGRAPLRAAFSRGATGEPRRTALVLAGPGTNRDPRRRVRAAARRRRTDGRARRRARSNGPSLLASRRASSVIAGGFSYGDALGAGRMLALDITHSSGGSDGGRLGEALREFVDAGEPVLGMCNGFQVLTRAGLLPGSLGHNDGRPLRLPVGRAGQGAERALRLDHPRPDDDPLPDRPRRGALRAPRSGRRSPPPVRWRCATPAATRTGRSPTSPACATRPGSCSA